MKQLTNDITICESGGLTTRAAYREPGYDRIAKYYGTSLVSFEEQPLDRYFVPKAEVQKEVFLPRIISSVVRMGNAVRVCAENEDEFVYRGDPRFQERDGHIAFQYALPKPYLTDQ